MSALNGPVRNVEFRVLGSLQVALDGRQVSIRGPVRRRLLVGLLTRPNDVVPSDRLVDLLWGDRIPDDASNSLSTHVSRLRGDLGCAADGGSAVVRIEHRNEGYALVVPGARIDAARFEELVAEARAVMGHAPEDGAARLEAALGLWRGRAFGEFADAPYVRPEAQRLEELRRTATEDLFDAALGAGRHREIVGEIAAFAERHPFRERPRGQLMLALHGSGRQADALAAYRSFRDELDRELGLEPSTDLQRLETDILRHADTLRPPRDAIGRQQARPTTRAPLPVPTTGLIGRDHDIGRVRDLLTKYRIVTLTGVGGVGKTRLAGATAAGLESHYADGVVWCALDEVEEPSVAAAVATAAGVRQRPEWTVEASLFESLRSAEMLLVVDNCEHVVDVVAPLLVGLARACPRMRVLATSRERLAVEGEHLWQVEPLAVPTTADDTAGLTDVDSVRLLVERARTVAPNFAVTADNAGPVAAICTRLDGVPLAIELAGARLRSMSATELADRLDDRLRLLAADRRTAPGRHRTLEAVAAWSYDLLTDAERQVFDRVSVFAGGFGLDAAETIAAGGDIDVGDVSDLLAALVDHSMVTSERSGPVTRYRVLEFIRRFGRAQLEQRGEARQYRRRHARWFVSVAQRNEELLYGPSEADAVVSIDLELANLRTAHRWLVSASDVDGALHLWTALAPYAFFRLSGEILAWAQQALAVPGADTHPRYARACATAAICMADSGQRRRAVELADTALHLADRDDPAARHGLLALALVDLYEGRLEACLRRSGKSRRLATAVGDPYWAALSALHEVLALAYGGDVDAALSRAEMQRRLAEASRNPTQIAWSLYTRGETLLAEDPAQAQALLTEAVDVASSVRNELVESVALVSLTSLHARHGSPTEALRSFKDVIHRWRRSGDRTHHWTTLRNLAELLARIHYDRAAAALLSAAHAADTAAPAYGQQARRLAELQTALAERLGQVGWEAATGRGATMDGDAAVEFALEQISEALESRPP